MKVITLTRGGLALTGQKSAEAIIAGNTSEGPNIKWGMKMVRSRNLLRRQKTHRVYPEKEVVQLLNNQGEPSRYPAQTSITSQRESHNDLIKEILSRENMLKALKKVEQNRGAPGIDNLTVAELKPYLHQNWLSIKEQLLRETISHNPSCG